MVVKDKEKVNREIEDFKKFLADVKPSDFERYDRTHPPTSEGPDPAKGPDKKDKDDGSEGKGKP